MCVAIVQRYSEPHGPSRIGKSKAWVNFLDDDKLDDMDDYHIDFEDAFRNILECDGDPPTASDADKLDGSETYPPCILQIKVIRDPPS